MALGTGKETYWHVTSPSSLAYPSSPRGIGGSKSGVAFLCVVRTPKLLYGFKESSLQPLKFRPALAASPHETSSLKPRGYIIEKKGPGWENGYWVSPSTLHGSPVSQGVWTPPHPARMTPHLFGTQPFLSSPCTCCNERFCAAHEGNAFSNNPKCLIYR